MCVLDFFSFGESIQLTALPPPPGLSVHIILSYADTQTVPSIFPEYQIYAALYERLWVELADDMQQCMAKLKNPGHFGETTVATQDAELNSVAVVLRKWVSQQLSTEKAVHTHPLTNQASPPPLSSPQNAADF